jgi:hypothetical protein
MMIRRANLFISVLFVLCSTAFLNAQSARSLVSDELAGMDGTVRSGIGNFPERSPKSISRQQIPQEGGGHLDETDSRISRKFHDLEESVM